MRIIGPGRVVVAGLPQTKMDLYFLDQRIVFNKCDNLHRPLAFGAKQWIDLINFLYQPSPVSPKCCYVRHGFL